MRELKKIRKWETRDKEISTKKKKKEEEEEEKKKIKGDRSVAFFVYRW
jgi:hypothetical protein